MTRTIRVLSRQWNHHRESWTIYSIQRREHIDLMGLQCSLLIKNKSKNKAINKNNILLNNFETILIEFFAMLFLKELNCWILKILIRFFFDFYHVFTWIFAFEWFCIFEKISNKFRILEVYCNKHFCLFENIFFIYLL